MILSCKEASRLQASSVVEELSTAEKLALRLHLVICFACRRVNQQLQFVTRAYKEWEQKLIEDDTVRLPDSSKKIIKEKLLE